MRHGVRQAMFVAPHKPFCLLVAAPPIPFERMINHAAARSVNALEQEQFSAAPALFPCCRFDFRPLKCDPRSPWL